MKLRVPKHCIRQEYYDEETGKRKIELICDDEYGTRHHHFN